MSARTFALVVALVSLAPVAVALDVLPAESRLEATTGAIVVRASGPLVVDAEPPVEVGAGADEPARTPQTFAANGTWRGLEGVITLVVRRDDAGTPVELFLEDGSGTGAWIEWPAEERGAARRVPGGLAPLALGVLAAALARRR